MSKNLLLVVLSILVITLAASLLIQSNSAGAYTPNSLDSNQIVIPPAQAPKQLFDEWQTIKESRSVTIKQDGDVLRFVFIVDPAYADITVRDAEAESQFLDTILNDRQPDADCAFSGGWYEITDINQPVIQSYPIITDGQVIPGSKTAPGTTTLYINHGQLSMSSPSLNEDLSPSQFAISGVSIQNLIDSGKDNEDPRTFLAIHQNKLIVLNTTFITPSEVESLLISQGVEAKNILVLNDYPQSGCFGTRYFGWFVVQGSGLFVTEK